MTIYLKCHKIKQKCKNDIKCWSLLNKSLTIFKTSTNKNKGPTDKPFGGWTWNIRRNLGSNGINDVIFIQQSKETQVWPQELHWFCLSRPQRWRNYYRNFGFIQGKYDLRPGAHPWTLESTCLIQPCPMCFPHFGQDMEDPQVCLCHPNTTFPVLQPEGPRKFNSSPRSSSISHRMSPCKLRKPLDLVNGYCWLNTNWATTALLGHPQELWHSHSHHSLLRLRKLGSERLHTMAVVGVLSYQIWDWQDNLLSPTEGMAKHKPSPLAFNLQFPHQ